MYDLPGKLPAVPVHQIGFRLASEHKYEIVDSLCVFDCTREFTNRSIAVSIVRLSYLLSSKSGELDSGKEAAISICLKLGF